MRQPLAYNSGESLIDRTIDAVYINYGTMGEKGNKTDEMSHSLKLWTVRYNFLSLHR